MSLLLALLVGGLVGWAASRLMGRDEGVVASVVIGIIGSVLGGLLSMMFTGSNQAYLDFSWPGLLWSFMGSVVLVFLLNAIQSRHHTSTM